MPFCYFEDYNTTMFQNGSRNRTTFRRKNHSFNTMKKKSMPKSSIVRGCGGAQLGTTCGILFQKGPNPILSTLRKTRIFGAFSLFSLTPPRKKAESHPWSTVSLSRWCCFSPPIFFLEALTHRLRYGTLLSANKRIFTILKFFTPECTRIKKATHIRTTWLGSNSGGS